MQLLIMKQDKPPHYKGDIVRDGKENNVTIFEAKAIDEGTYVEYLGWNDFLPKIDYSECVLSAGHKVVFNSTYYSMIYLG